MILKFQYFESYKDAIDQINDILINNSDDIDIEYSINDMNGFYVILIESTECYNLYTEIDNKVLRDKFEILSSTFFDVQEELENISTSCNFMSLKIKPMV